MATLDDKYYAPLWSYDPDVVVGEDFKSFESSNKNKGLEYADANMVNYYMTERSNYQNMLQWQATNAWNKYMWDLENEYNSPDEQVRRLMEAGINPLWAMQSGDAGKAQQLTAQNPSPVTPPSFSYEPRSLDNQMSMFAQTNALNSMLGMGDLDIKNRNLAIQDRLSRSEIQKTQAEINLIKTQTETNQFINQINSETYGVQVNQKITDLNLARQTLENLRSQGDLTKAQEKLLKTTEEKEQLLKDQVIAATRKIEQDINNDLVRLSIEFQQLAINQQNANSMSVQASAAATQASVAQQNATTADRALSHQIEKDEKELEVKTTEQILEIMDNQRGWLDRLVGSPNNMIASFFGNGDNAMLQRTLSMVQAGAHVLTRRFYSNPTKTNADAIDRTMKIIQDLQSKVQMIPLPMPNVTPAGTSVMNPSQPSQSWSQ